MKEKDYLCIAITQHLAQSQMEDKSAPLVSIIIPLYNCEEYIEECLNSVMNQKFSNFEVIVVDDGSTDEGPRLVESYKDVKLVRQTNQGVTAARKTGVANAKGEWIMFVDADDTVKEEIISTWLPLMREDIDIIVGKMKSDKVATAQQLTYDIQDIRKFPKAPWLKLFRRSLFDSSDALDIPREIVWGEDMLMLLRLSMVAKGKVAYSTEKDNYEYRRHSSQVTKTFRVTSEYEKLYNTLLFESIAPDKQDLHFLKGSIKYRLSVLERILKDSRFTGDDVRNSEWFATLKEDIKKANYRPTLWFRTLLRFGTADNIHRLRSIKWIYRCFNACH